MTFPTTMKRPASGTSRPYHFPDFQRQTLPNGLRTVIAPISKLPLVSIVALIEAGAVCDSSAHAGLARLTAKLLLEGTERDDGATLSERFEQLGASVNADADWDGASIGMTVLARNVAPALDLLNEVLRSPAFPDREVDRLKSERQAELMQLRSEPRELADESFDQILYVPGSRYVDPQGGTPESVAAITRDDIQRFYSARYLPSQTTIVITGGITYDEAEALVTRTIGSWTGPRIAPVITDDRPAYTGRAVHLIDRPEAPQSELRIGHIGLPRRHPDYFPVVVMNAILGGLFSSRINLNLREVHGYTYGAHSEFNWRQQAGPFVVSTAVQSEVTADAAREVVSEIERIRKTPVTSDELSLATSFLDGVFPIRYETTESIANALSTLTRYQLPDDYFNVYRTHIRNVSVADILRVAHDHLHPDSLQMVVVGQIATVRESLQALHFGPVSML